MPLLLDVTRVGPYILTSEQERHEPFATGVSKELVMKGIGVFALVAAMALGASGASARTALQDDATIENGLVLVAVGKMMRDQCPDISPRYIKAFAFAKSLESRAKSLGYSSAEIDAYLKSKSDKKRVKAKARDWIASRGDDVCEVGRAEIAGGTTLGALLRAN